MDPDAGGEINIGGVDYWLSGYLKRSKAGEKFLKVIPKPKDDRAVERSYASQRDDAAF